MPKSKIIVRMSKSTQLHNKNGKYEIMLNNEIKAELDSINNKQFFTVESGKNIIQIKNENTTIVKDVILKEGQYNYFKVKCECYL